MGAERTMISLAVDQEKFLVLPSLACARTRKSLTVENTDRYGRGLVY